MKNDQFFMASFPAFFIVPFIILFLGTMLLSQAAMADNTLYVQSAKAKLLASPSFASKLLHNMERGVALHVVETSERWVKVKHNDQLGWVSKLLLSPSPPTKKNSILFKPKNDVTQKARRRASSTATAAATRGFRSERHSRANDLENGDYDALEKVESITIEEAEAWKFHQEGIKQ